MTLPIKPAAALAEPREGSGEAIAQLMSAFSRYAGWLGNNQPSTTVRTHAQGLERAVDAGVDTGTWIALLDTDLKRLPSGEIPKMLRRTLSKIVVVLESVDQRPGIGPPS
jgi:hypothetical protein